jgi:cellulose synthase/poly-beta-1,6-N-acetylglucosamine synthase-like glycosyltransferase
MNMGMSKPELLFWICVGLVAYNYVGYPLVLFLLSVVSQAKSDLLFLFHRGGRRCAPSIQYVPRVAVLMSAHNEEAVIRAKVKNTLESNYPCDRLEFLIGLDSPTDSTADLLSQMEFGQLRVTHFKDRRGKLAVLTSLAEQTAAEILVITDANTRLDTNCIRNLVRHFMEPKVGAVSGEENRVASPGSDPAAEALYWRYESALKLLENRLDCTMGGNGSVLAVRRTLFRPRKRTIIEDFQIPLEIRLRGYRVIYDPEALAVEEIAPTLSAQFARRVRIGAGNYQTLFANLQCLNPLKGMLAFCFFSHRVLRWFAPLLLFIAFVCSVLMAGHSNLAILLAVQSAFYLCACLGYLLKKLGKPVRLFALPLHFCSMNLAMLLGLLRYLSGEQGLTWTSTPRQVQSPLVMGHREPEKTNHAIGIPRRRVNSDSSSQGAFQGT